MIKVSFNSQKKLQQKVRRFVKGGETRVKNAIRLSAFQIQGQIRRNISRGSRSGRTYDTFFYTDKFGRLRKIGKRPPHKASAPGEFPKTDTGVLVASMFADSKDDGWAFEVGSDLKYAFWLEFGTKKMEARPWLQPTFDALKPQIGDRIRNALNESIRKTK